MNVNSADIVNVARTDDVITAAVFVLKYLVGEKKTAEVKRVLFKCHFHYDTYAEVWRGYTHAGYFLSGPRNFFLLYFEHVKITTQRGKKSTNKQLNNNKDANDDKHNNNNIQKEVRRSISLINHVPFHFFFLCIPHHIINTSLQFAFGFRTPLTCR